VEELLPQAEMSVRRPISDILVGCYAEKKQFDKAQEMINQISALDEFPYGSAAKVMDAMTPEMMAEKQGLFSQALSSFKRHEHYKPGLFTAIDSGFTDLVVRFGPSMPPKLVLAAIDEILSQSKPTAEEREETSITLGGDGGIASFRTRYEFELFALLPLLEQLDESRAKHLLEDDQRLQSSLQKYPQGLNSVAPPPKDLNKNRRGLSTQISQGNSGTTRSGYMSEEAFRKAQEIAQEGETDPTQAMAQAMTLPVMLEARTGASPRADALEAIARANMKKNPTAADLALSELRKITADLSLRLQGRYLSSAGDLYLQMGEQENAEKIVSEGFKVADKLLEIDANPNSPNQALKAWWPSTDAYRRFVEVQAKISRPATFNVLKEIRDPEIRAAESITFARSLLGLPLKRVLVAVRRKGSDSMSISDTN
jgi:hypothetical protein